MSSGTRDSWIHPWKIRAITSGSTGLASLAKSLISSRWASIAVSLRGGFGRRRVRGDCRAGGARLIADLHVARVRGIDEERRLLDQMMGALLGGRLPAPIARQRQEADELVPRELVVEQLGLVEVDQ